VFCFRAVSFVTPRAFHDELSLRADARRAARNSFLRPSRHLSLFATCRMVLLCSSPMLGVLSSPLQRFLARQSRSSRGSSRIRESGVLLFPFFKRDGTIRSELLIRSLPFFAKYLLRRAPRKFESAAGFRCFPPSPSPQPPNRTSSSSNPWRESGGPRTALTEYTRASS